MKLHTKVVHIGDRKKAGRHVPVTTPIHTAASYFYESMEQLDRVFGQQDTGFSYARYDNPSTAALEELVATLESGHGALACASGMAAIHMAIETALVDRRRSIVAASALYGATVSLLMQVMEPAGVAVRFADVCDLDGLRAAVAEAKPGCILVETISNPLLRVGQMDRIAAIAREAGAALVVDSTFATPLILRPIELGAHLVVHSATKYLSGHGDVLGGVVVSDAEHFPTLRSLSRTLGPVMGPFEAYLTMRGIKTFALRMERQCANACRVASYLATHPRIARVYFPAGADHPDAAAIRRLFPPNLYGAIVSFELKDAGREEVFRFMDALRLIVRATSLGDVHSMMLYPVMSSHREISPKHRERMGIGDGLVRLSVGIEAPEDIIEDLEQALR
ncbi:MAG TPA: aminotransferase class I/II-fold pyridoxal phosphate-dependent enzyme [Bryobacteraceae bacterium]|nr:aminotransferase class I/II-fold pyridoxal phosphate-dependent enzyme [Bryobacteraceae bacterium]